MLTISPSQESNRKSGLSGLAAGLALTLALSLGQAQEVSGQNATQIKNGKEIGVGTTTRTVDEMQIWIAKNLLEERVEADALDEAWPYINELDIKIIDNLVDRCDKKIIGRATAKGSIFFLICKKHKNKVLRDYIQSKIKAGRYTEEDLQDIIDGCTLSAGLVTIKK